MNIAVVGSGIGGLCTSIRLANKGHKVMVYEKNDKPGGKMAEIRAKGYRFDTGPSLFTLPQLLEQLFTESGEQLSNYLKYNLLENNCKYFYPDNTVFNFYHDKDKLKKEIEENTLESYANIYKRLKQSEDVYNISAPVFLFNDFHKLSNFNTPPFKKILFKLHKLDFIRTMHCANIRSFKDRNMVQLFDRYATYNGSNPYRAPATLNMIAHLENNIGAFFPEKGMYAIVDALFKLAIKKGVNFSFNNLVSKIIVENKKVTGINVEEQFFPYDIVVSDSDTKYIARNMLKHPLDKRLTKSTPSSSAMIFYWGINKEHQILDVHNILFSNDYKKEFDSIFNKRTIIDDPTVYIFISSKVVPDDAPKGCENWFVMINVPANTGQDWDKLIAYSRSNIIKKINKTFSIDIESSIEFEQIGYPLSIEQKTLSFGGSLYGSASNSMFSAFLRHPNKLSSIKNLYFVGGSVHPGGGIPLCIASSEIVSREIP